MESKLFKPIDEWLIVVYVVLRFSRSYFHLIDFHDILNFDPIVRWTVDLESSSERKQGTMQQCDVEMNNAVKLGG